MLRLASWVRCSMNLLYFGFWCVLWLCGSPEGIYPKCLGMTGKYLWKALCSAFCALISWLFSWKKEHRKTILDKNKCRKLELMCCKIALGLSFYRQADWGLVQLQLLQLALQLTSLCYGLPIAACDRQMTKQSSCYLPVYPQNLRLGKVYLSSYLITLMQKK